MRRRTEIVIEWEGSPYWYSNFTSRINGRRIRRSTKETSRAKAKLIVEGWIEEDKRKARLGIPSTITLDEACGRYWLEHAHSLPSAGTIKIQMSHLLRIIGPTRTLDKINTAVVSDYIAWRRGEWIRRGHGPKKEVNKPGSRLVSESTVNREVRSCLRAIMNKAAKRWCYSVATINWDELRGNEPEGRQRYLTVEEAKAVIQAAAPHARPAITIALYTGLRLSNVMRLDWAQVDLQRQEITVRIKSRKKGGKTLGIPIASPLLVLLANLSPKDDGPVLTYKGEPVKNMRRAFKTALKKVGITDFHWHDLRHTAASLMLDAGVPIDMVRKALGHTDIKTTLRYAHRPQAAMRDAFAKLGDMLSSDGTNGAQKPTLKEVS